MAGGAGDQGGAGNHVQRFGPALFHGLDGRIVSVRLLTGPDGKARSSADADPVFPRKNGLHAVRHSGGFPRRTYEHASRAAFARGAAQGLVRLAALLAHLP